VGSTDANDYYRFNLISSSNFNLALNGLVADADVQLLDSSGNAIASSTAGSTTAEAISRTLNPGTYYIRVYPYGGVNTNYNLSVSATINDFAGNTLNNARQITLNETNSTYSDWVGSSDTDDFYRFNLSSNSSVNLTLNGLIENADVQLLNSSGNMLTSSTVSGAVAESINRSLDAGTYYIRVYPYNGANTNYNLSVSATINDYAGNTLNNARQINLDSVATTYSDWVGSADTNDFYRFNLSQTSSFNLTLNGLVADADVQLIWDSNSNGVIDSGEVIASSAAGSTTAEAISRTLSAGTYYIQVYPYSSANTNYNLSASITPNDYAGNTLNNARQIAVNSTTSTYTDWVGSADTNDYYRFSLDTTRNLNLAMNGLSGNADVQLLDSSGNALASSTDGGTAAESISRTLGAGTYYIRVYPGNSGASTFYNLSIESTTAPVYSNQLNLAWIRQLGTAGDDFSYSVATDSAGNVYITGYTDGSLGGTNAGGADAWLAKFDTLGNRIWTKQLGAISDDVSYGVAVDSGGNVYITGEGNFSGNTEEYSGAWLAKYDTFGNSVWTKQLGTFGKEFSTSITVDSTGHIYVTGGTPDGTDPEDIDIWIAKYNSDGNMIWTAGEIGGDGFEISNSVTTHSGGNAVYMTGGTEGALGGTNTGDFDAWVAAYDKDKVLHWKRQLGTGTRDYSFDVAVDSVGNVYITGGTEGSLGGTSAGDVDAWLAKYDSIGNLMWTRQLGTSGFDVSNGIVIDSTGNVYITGLTDGALGGTNFGEVDAWVAKYDSNGNQISIKQIGTPNNDVSKNIAIDSTGHIYITGTTRGALQGTNAGSIDAWIAKFH
jgi:hypothetical protein